MVSNDMGLLIELLRSAEMRRGLRCSDVLLMEFCDVLEGLV